MTTAKPILRVGKIKKSGRTTLSSVGGHLARSRPTPNADPARSEANAWLIGSPDLDAHVESLMTRVGLDPSSTRKDAVVANDILLTISPEWFRPANPSAGGTWDADRLDVFKAEAEQFLRKTFGARCVAAVLHLDEATPHIQAIVVPVMKSEKGVKLSAKDMFDPQRLTQLQQDWEDRLAPHGVGPRIKRSKAKHTTLREYYGALEEFARGEDDRAKIVLSEPPKKGVFQKAETHQAEVDKWRRAEAKRLRQELKPMATAAAKGRLYDSEKRMRINAAGRINFQKDRLDKLAEELKVTKEQAAKLRTLPINRVAAELDHTGPIGPKENAIDLVMRSGELTYGQATAWLAQRFGVDAAAASVRERTEKALQGPQKAVLTASERVRAKLIAQQLQALSAPSYRLTAMYDRDGDRHAVNIGKAELDRDELSRLDVVRLLPTLGRHNRMGGNIFVTPIDPDTQHMLVDDLRGDKLAEFQAKGYTPAVLIETSPGNHQAMLKVPTMLGTKEDRNEVFKDLNRTYGDEAITGLVHPMRLAGFENRKDKHRDAAGQFPFVRIISAVNGFCQRTMGLVRHYQLRREERAQEELRLQQAQERAEAAAYRPPSPR